MQDTGQGASGRRVVRRISMGLVRLAARVLLRVRVTGLERVPGSGPVILVANHINFIEPFLIYVLMPRQVTALGKVELWGNPITRLWAESWGTIPIRRGEVDLSAIRSALQVLQQGGMLGLAPEGTRSHHGRLQRARQGAVLLALHSPGTLILPVAVYGQERFHENVRRLRRTAVQMVIGQGFYLNTGEGRVTHEMRQAISDEIMMQIAALLPAQNRGVYSELPPAAPRYLRPAHRE